MAMTTHLADRVRALARRPRRLARAFPTTCANGSRCRTGARMLPGPDQLLVETFPHDRPPLHGRLQLRGLERAPVARHADHPADGERRAEAAGLRRQRLCARLLRARADRPIPAPLFSPDILEHEFVDWVQSIAPAEARLPRGGGDRRAGRAPASGQAQDRASRSPSRPTSSTTCCAATSPTICCSRAAWADARARMTDVGRLAGLLDRAAGDDGPRRARPGHPAGGAGDGR